MKKRLLATVVCMLMVFSCFASVSFAETEDTAAVKSYVEANDNFFYPFNGDGEWTKSKLNLASHAMSSFRQSDGINESGMLQMKNDASMGAVSAGVTDIKMRADENLVITGKVRYENYESLMAKHMYLQAYLTGLSGAPLYTDASCTEKSGDATGGFVTATAKVDINGASLGDGAWHTFIITLPTKGMKHSTGAYADLTDMSVNLWLRPYAGNTFTATTNYFTQAFLDECAANDTIPYANILLDDFEGYFAKEPHVETYHKTKTSLFYNFNSADSADTTSIVGTNANRAYLESYEGETGAVSIKNPIGSLTTLQFDMQGVADHKLRVAGDIALLNGDDLNADNIDVTAVLIMNGGSTNNPAGFYEDEACTIPAESVSGNAICHSTTLLSGIGANGWVHYSHDFDTLSVYKSSIKRLGTDSAKTTVYIKPNEVANISVWFRVTADGPMASVLNPTEKSFTAKYLTECGYKKDGDAWVADPEKEQITPYMEYALDNFTITNVHKDVPSEDTTTGGNIYHKTATSLFYNFNSADAADTKSYIGTSLAKTFLESYDGKTGVVTLKNEIGSVNTPVYNMKAVENKKLRVAGDIALVNADNLNTEKINVNALLILNGGTNNNPAGFYEDEACTIPAESVNGNAICHQATMLSGIGADGWAHFSHDFDTTTVYKSSIKRTAADSAKSTVYIKPWEVENVCVWFRVATGAATNVNVTTDENYFTADYLTACGYVKGEDGKWTADAEKEQTKPYLEYALDNFTIKNVGTETKFKDFKIENVSLSASGMLDTGKTVDITYTVSEGFTESETRVYLLADGEIVGYAKASGGKVQVEAARELFGKTLSVKMIPATDSVYALHTYETEIGTVSGSMKKLTAEGNGIDTVTWKYDVIGDTEAAQVITALYGAKGELLTVSVTDVAAKIDANGVLAKGSASHEKVQTAKVMIWDAVSGMKPLCEPQIVEFPAINNNPFADDDEINIVFVGDSIYANTGAGGEKNGFVYQVGEWMKEEYAEEGKTINWYNTSFGGTTTDYTFVRFRRDVLSKNPDMIFFAMTCNDGAGTDTLRNVESCINMVNEMEDKPYMMLTFFTNKSWRVSPGYGEQLSKFYDIPLFNNTEAMRAAVAAGADVESLYSDGVHPSAAGYKIIAEALKEMIGTNRYFAKPAERSEKLTVNSGSYDTMEVFAASDETLVTRNGSWTAGSNYLKSTTVGDSLSFNFTGDILAFETALNQYAGKVEVWVDGELVWVDDPYYNMTGYQMTVRAGNFNFDLPYGDHNVELKIAEGQKTAEAGQMETRIYNIFAGSWK